MLFLFFALHSSYAEVTTTRLTSVNVEVNSSPTSTAHKAFVVLAKQKGIAARSQAGFSNVYNGYYIISGVFGNSDNAARLSAQFKAKNLDAQVLIHPQKKLNYVSLGHHVSGIEAVNSAVSQLEGKFKDKVWILHVYDGKTITLDPSKTTIDKTSSVTATISSNQFKISIKALGIASRIDTDLKSSTPGYYIIAGVFGEGKNADRLKFRLREQGYAARSIIHPESGNSYVYLDQFQEANRALAFLKDYTQKERKHNVWVLEVEPLAAETKENFQAAKNNVPAKSVQSLNLTPINDKDPFKNKLLKKADFYFGKMWYAEAAELYEQLLNRNEKYHTFDVIEKAGDAHYFNTNMERAYDWYDLLYGKYKDQMTAENIFKYAHSLKGTGKYARAKRLMRLYNKKLKKEDLALLDNENQATPREVILDNILNTEEQFTVKNLAINSKYSDFGPMYYNEDELVFASAADSSFFTTRRYKWNNEPYLDLYAAKINEESEDVKQAIKFPKNINTKYHEASVAFTADNQTMFFTRNNYGKKLKRDKHGVNHLKIYTSKKVGDEWTDPEEVPFNSDDWSTGHPVLSPDGKQMYFVSDRPGSIGDSDIFVVDILGDNSFSEPKNLGPEINTERREMFPFINDKKLYFSSDGHVGLGGLDVYEVAFDEEQGFLEVRNLGKPINSNKDDFSYIVNENSGYGYFASNRQGGKGSDDIYSFKKILPEEPNENAIAGIVTELVTGEILPEALVELLDENGRKIKEMVTGDDGSFLFEDLESNTKYTVHVTKGDYFDQQVEVTTKDNMLVETDIAMRRLEDLISVEDGIRKLKLDMIFFDFDKSYIRPDAAEELDKLVTVMNEYPTMVIAVESHTDSRGKRAYNRLLSDRRAKSTREYLISKGIDPERIQSAIGYGEERLLNECNGTVRCSSAQHQLNRRSEFIIVNM
ncbi:MAG: OmpA family protein [Eudoraea sp.]|nr:OmpA family protein [Eudoraea sp.]